MTTLYDLIIIGGGPAGTAGAVYAARKQLKTLLILKEWGGQSIVSTDIQNWIGTPHISGAELAESFKAHTAEYKGDYLTIEEGALVNDITGSFGSFIVSTDKGFAYNSKTVLIATGSSRRKLEIPGAIEFENKGITYCASCDGPMFSGTDVVVVGGGNAGFESSAQLLAYCKSVTLLSRSEPKADEITVNKLTQISNFKMIKNAVPKEIKGTVFVDSLVYTNTETNEDITLPASGIFVEIGQIPQTDFAKNIVARNANNQVEIDPWSGKTSKEGIWAAGDCTNVLYHQNNIAVGDAVRALEDIYLHIHTK